MMLVLAYPSPEKYTQGLCLSPAASKLEGNESSYYSSSLASSRHCRLGTSSHEATCTPHCHFASFLITGSGNTGSHFTASMNPIEVLVMASQILDSVTLTV